VRAWAELLGLASTLLSRGTRGLVASVCALPDTAAAGHAMAALHGALVGGASPGAALDGVLAATEDDEVLAVTRCLACFGAS
jgi:hypothetical protein